MTHRFFSLALVLCAFVALLSTSVRAGVSEDMSAAQAAFAQANATKGPTHPGYAKAYGIWSRLAGDGDSQAKYHLGILHLYGLGGASFDHIQGYDLIKASAEGGYAQAQAYVGVMHEKGNGLHFRKGAEAARGWYEKAAGAGNCYAVRRLAQAHASGELGLTADAAASDSYRAEQPSCFGQ